jgi:hypothetical protein
MRLAMKGFGERAIDFRGFIGATGIVTCHVPSLVTGPFVLAGSGSSP